ncbi:hypothetical protein PR202_gb17670 [Eleusine coracana subsp. coracana]|uniref:Uncharacterized protein n=1 Tax=Eleusine coracana subsp. coracana TaxID=191504 RepID=A0AAV5F1A2_ELECO|nr:hypothetical protein PR202_gb17670 [Eleusine coracana subsp. coracana]
MARVEVLTSELVIPADETPAESIWLSNLDLAARRGYTPTVYFYRPNGEPGFFAADARQAQPRKALVASNPLAAASASTPPRARPGGLHRRGRRLRTPAPTTRIDLMNEFARANQDTPLSCPGARAEPACALLFAARHRLRCRRRRAGPRAAPLRRDAEARPTSSRRGQLARGRPHGGTRPCRPASTPPPRPRAGPGARWRTTTRSTTDPSP